MENASNGFSLLETSILKAKGLDEAKIQSLQETGLSCRDDFKIVGDTGTLAQLIGVSEDVAKDVMDWALGTSQSEATANTNASATSPQQVVVDSADTVYCVHCKTRQPKDYTSGDMCPACGRQAEPILTCYWCNSSGPGAFCRECGSKFVPTGELELALLLKREGVAREAIYTQLTAMDDAEKDILWGRVRSQRR